jgi:hypothetical protein
VLVLRRRQLRAVVLLRRQLLLVHTALGGGTVTVTDAYGGAAVEALLTTLVLSISGLFRSLLSKWYQSLSIKAFKFLLVRVNETSQARTTTGMTSSRWKLMVLKPFLLLNATNLSPFSLVIAIFQLPFCSLESPTCHFDVPLGSLMHTFHIGLPNIFWFTFSRKGT